MRYLLHLPRLVGVAGMLLLLWSPALRCQQKDSLLIIQSPGNGAYQCCYDFLVTNRHHLGTTIAEFRLRIISGNATFISGQSSSPPSWAIFQFPTNVSWTSNTAQDEIDSGQTLSNFHVCVADTGVFRMVWETRNIGTLLSSDTLAFVCTGKSCDEAFFTYLPSDQACVFDINLVNGNRIDAPVNDFHLRMLTPGAHFITSPSQQPLGWNRLRADTNLISYQTSNGVRFHQWAEGFRIAAIAPADSFRVAWWTTNFGDEVCHDTVTLHCLMSQRDSVRISRTIITSDSCCSDLTLKNTHLPATPIEAFTLKVLTPRARLVAAPPAPAGWTSSGLNTAGDSVRFRSTTGLASSDSALFRNICFNNVAASTDTVLYQWQTYYKGVEVTQGTGMMICPRPLTVTDTLVARVDSTFPASSRCIFLTLRNRNSRSAAITRLVVKISNQGKTRTVVSATAPAGWQVQNFGGDSAVYIGGSLPAGGTLSGLQLCVSLGDATTSDPLHLRWTTANGLGTISSGTVDVNAIIVQHCDTIRGAGTTSSDASICCFKVRFYNRNTQGKTLDGLLLNTVDQSTIFSDATGQSPWSLVTPTFPSTAVGFTGGTLAPGDSTPEFTLCIKLQGTPTFPRTIPLLWSTFAGPSAVCTDTLRLVCTGNMLAGCDTAIQVSSDNTGGICSPGFRVVNRHSPASTIDQIEFHIVGAGHLVGASVSGKASSWSMLTFRPDTVVFRGDSLIALDSTERFILNIDSTNGNPVTIEACTGRQGIPVCCAMITVNCATADIDLSLEPIGFRLYENVPNPFSSTTDIRYKLMKPAAVTLTIRDESGRVMRRIEKGMMQTGEHSIHIDGSDFPSGVYYYWLEAGGERDVRRMVVVR